MLNNNRSLQSSFNLNRRAPLGKGQADLELTFDQNAISQTRLAGRSQDSNRGRQSQLQPGDGLSRTENRLAKMINDYRAQNGLPDVELSKALTIVANRHVRDLQANDGFGGELHSWSDAPYDANNPATFPAMWNAPKRLKTGYRTSSYEIAFGAPGFPDYRANPQDALNGWKGSPSHNSVVLNQGAWGQLKWKAMGVGIHGGYAVVWFGDKSDRTGTPAKDNR